MVAALMVVMTLQYTQMKSYNAMHLKFIFIHQFYLNKEKLNLSNIKKRERERITSAVISAKNSFWHSPDLVTQPTVCP